MNGRLKGALIGFSGFLLLLGGFAGEAAANYGGLADGGPGPSDIWAATHPSFGRVTHQHKTHHMILRKYTK
jgi:hypothetical protein